jgi:hypothetical protein
MLETVSGIIIISIIINAFAAVVTVDTCYAVPCYTVELEKTYL